MGEEGKAITHSSCPFLGPSSTKNSVWFLLISAYMTECQFLAEKTLPGQEVSSWLNN